MADPNKLLYARHLETRQKHTAEALTEAGYDGLLILSGSPRMYFLDDQGPPFRSNPHFTAWLPLPAHPECALLIRPGQTPKLWYYQPEDFWHVPPPAPESWWADALEVEICRKPDLWRKPAGSVGALAVIAEEPGQVGGLDRADINPEGLVARLHEHRTEKTAWERHLLMEANRLAAAGHRAAAGAFREGLSELEIHLRYQAAVGQSSSDLPYSSIVGVNEHAAVLHYQHQSSRRPDDPRTLLIDAGAGSKGYAADVTRTTTTDNGDFAAMIRDMDEGQQRLCERARAGVSFVDLHQSTHLLVGAILQKFDVVDLDPDSMVEAGITGTFFPHGLGHFIGVQVHDVAGKTAPDGSDLPPPDGHPALRLTRRLESGNVITIEPGIYFIPVLLEKLRNSGAGKSVNWTRVDDFQPFGGIRIEDDVLVTDGDPVNFTRQALEETPS